MQIPYVLQTTICASNYDVNSFYDTTMRIPSIVLQLS
jgi:hypothetical protein